MPVYRRSSKVSRLGSGRRQTACKYYCNGRKLAGFDRSLIGSVCVDGPAAFGLPARKPVELIIGAGIGAGVNRALGAISLEIVSVLGHGLAILSDPPRFIVIRV